MKKVLALMLLVMFLGIPAMADDTGVPDWDNPDVLWIPGEKIDGFLDDTGILKHKHEYYVDKKDRAKLGLGLDLVIAKPDNLIEEVVVETRVDLNNDRISDEEAYSAMLVGRIDLSKLWK